MTTDELFDADVVASVSPRLAWIERHRIVTHKVESNPDTWLAGIAQDAQGLSGIRAWFAADKQSWDKAKVGVGDTENDALTDLAVKHGLRLWFEPSQTP